MGDDADELLKKYKGILPSRGQLRRKALFGTEEQRATANRLLRLLPKSDPSKEDWQDSAWSWNLTPEELSQSPAGQFILDNCGPSSLDSDKVAEPEGNVAPEPEPAAGEQTIPPAIPDGGVNDYLKKLAWPPKSTPKPKAPEEGGVKHLWQAAKPTPPSKDQQFLPPDGDYSSNSPIY
jgi:hypothetical protein